MHRFTLLLLCLPLFGCKEDPSPAAAASATASAAVSATAPVGLSAASNDAVVVKLAKAVIASCPFNQAGGYYKPTCDAVREFTGNTTLETAAGELTLIAMLFDPSEKVRGLAARGLGARGRAYRSDNGQATRVIEALTIEKHKGVARQLADAVARIDGKASDTLAALKKVAANHSLAEVRGRVLGPLLGANRDTLYDFVKERAMADADVGVRVAAVGAFWGHLEPTRTADACVFWLDRAGAAKSQRVAGKSAHFLALKKVGGDCGSLYDDLLVVIDKLATDGQVEDQSFSSALKHLSENSVASDAQKAKARTVAKHLVQNKKNHGIPRAEALRFVGATDKTWARTFAKDDSVHVRGAVERLGTR